MADNKAADVEMHDANSDGDIDTTEAHEQPTIIDLDLDEKYPNRPHNHSTTLPFHDLFLTLFNPLNENRKRPTGPIMARKKQGPHGPQNLSVHEQRRAIIERFISRWRKEVGNDIYPAFRLIVPEKDRDRAMYGLKEKTIGKILVRVMKIDKNSEDGFNLLNWKLPGVKATSAMAGDFAGRCFEVISKRPMLIIVGKLTIGEVNEMLDRLSMAQKENEQVPILEDFYNNMNAEEMMWLIRMILRQMKVGASEKTIFELWHPDAENLFNVSSSLRRVCWELSDPTLRLQGDDTGIALMQCFQPQLAAFQMHSMEKMVTKMNSTEDDPIFWIEEKLDGERMQLHMVEDDSIPGGFRFAFWSRKAKDYTYLYGNGFLDTNSSLTRHIKSAFNDGVRNIILDGEMITWDAEEDVMVAFGHLKTAALSEQRNEFAGKTRPLFRVFDCLYLNDKNLTDYTLRDRRKALVASVVNVHRRLEIHEYTEGTSAEEIEPLLRKVVAESTEGLVLKNPRSKYRLNQRNDDWIKVKPEYMAEFGESLDCVVIGGYYGSGHRGGRLSSFMCGLRIDENQVAQGANPMKCFSFFKVGGGFTAGDYAEIRHRTDGKWKDWDSKKPPIGYIELGGGDREFEKPDVWIRPDDSVVLCVKAASVISTPQFRMGYSLRFPRFKRLRTDKDWKSALSINEFMDLKKRASEEKEEKKFKVDDAKRQKRTKRVKKRAMTVLGQSELTTPYAGPFTSLFEGLSFYVLTESLKPKKSKGDIEQVIKANGGKLVQNERANETICIADRNLVKVASVKKIATRNLIKPAWIFDCIQQAEVDGSPQNLLLPYEPDHMFFTKECDMDIVQSHVDEFGDSYTRDANVEQLRSLMNTMPAPEKTGKPRQILEQMLDEEDIVKMPAWMFSGLRIYIVGNDDVGMAEDATPSSTPFHNLELKSVAKVVEFGGGSILEASDLDSATHVVFGHDKSTLANVRQQVSR